MTGWSIFLKFSFIKIKSNTTDGSPKYGDEISVFDIHPAISSRMTQVKTNTRSL